MTPASFSCELITRASYMNPFGTAGWSPYKVTQEAGQSPNSHLPLETQPPTPSAPACRDYFQFAKGNRTAFVLGVVWVSDALPLLVLADSFQSFQTEREYYPLSPSLSWKDEKDATWQPRRLWSISADLHHSTPLCTKILGRWLLVPGSLHHPTAPSPFITWKDPEKWEKKALIMASDGASGIPGLYPPPQSGRSGSHSILLAAGRERKVDQKKKKKRKVVDKFKLSVDIITKTAILLKQLLTLLQFKNKTVIATVTLYDSLSLCVIMGLCVII